MKTIIILFIASVVVDVTGAGAADVSLDELEERIRRQLAYPSQLHEIAVTPNLPPAHEVIRKTADHAGASPGELESVLFNLVNKTISSERIPRNGASWGIAGGALAALSRIGGASALDRMIAIAVTAPQPLDADAVQAAVYIANRTAPRRLPEVALRLGEGKQNATVYTMLHQVLTGELPTDPVERSGRIAIITDILKKRVHDRKYEDRVYLDQVLEEYDMGYRTSEERRRILMEESGSDNPNVKRYADAKLRNWTMGVGPNTLPTGSGPMKTSVSLTAKEMNTDKKNGSDTGSTIAIPVIIGAVVAFGALVWLLSKGISR
jgi:hypothetical protein